MTGALPDYVQIERILEQRLADPRVRIPRGFERNFDNPSTDADRRVRRLIDQYRAALTTTLEQKIFKEKKRLADAERKLQIKETKKALEDRRIASNWIETSLEKLSLQKGTQLHEDDNRIFPFTYAPIVIKRAGQNIVTLARYHLRQNGKQPSIDRQMDGLYNARRDNLTRFWRKEFGATHALMIVDSFFENVQREGQNEILHFTPQDRQQMFVACLYGEWTGPEGDLLSFAAVTDDPPPEIAAAGHDRCVINMRPENLETWLTPQGRSDDELQEILSDRQKPYYEHEVMAA
jgi:putative SOS response-associated peptidase YedK